MPLKDRISTMLHINTPQVGQNGYHSQPAVGTSPPHTPASINTNSTAATDPLSSPNTITTSSVYAKSSPDTASSSRQNSRGTPSPENAFASPKTGASRLASRLSTFPKRMLRHKHTTSQSNTISSFPLPPSNNNNNNINNSNSNSNNSNNTSNISSSNNGNSKYITRPLSQHNYAPPPGLPAPLSRPDMNPHAQSWRGHKQTKSALGVPTNSTIISLPAVVAHPQPQRPLTYHQPTNTTPFLYAAQSEFIAGPHPGRPYNPFEPRPSPDPQPPPPPPRQQKSSTDCWDDDPPHVRRRLQNRHWEVLFGDFSWASASGRRSRSSAVDRTKKAGCGDISPRSRSPSRSVREDRGRFWMREGEDEERGRSRLRTPTWADQDTHGVYPPNRSDAVQAKELAEKLARVRMKR